MRFLLRFLGLWILAGAFVALIIDGTKSIASNALLFTRLEQTWAELNQASLQQLQPAIERHVGSWLWDPVVRDILAAPTFAVLGVLGCLLVLLGRKKAPLIGYARD